MFRDLFDRRLLDHLHRTSQNFLEERCKIRLKLPADATARSSNHMEDFGRGLADCQIATLESESPQDNLGAFRQPKSDGARRRFG